MGKKAGFPINKYQTEKSCDQEENAVQIISIVIKLILFNTHKRFTK